MSASTGSTVAMLVAVLVLLGLGMIALAVWLVRSTRSDPQALGPLEVMGDRRFRKGDPDRRQANLDTARPAGAAAPAPMVAVDDNSDAAVPDPAFSGQSSDESPVAAGNSDAAVPDPVDSGQSSDESSAAAGNSDAAVPDPVDSGQSSDETPAAARNSDASVPEPVVSGQSSHDSPADIGANIEADEAE